MLQCESVEASDCAEIMVTTAQPTGASPQILQVHQEISSFQTLVDTALALEKNPQAEHSYAVSDEKMFLDGKEKDHNYSTSSKMVHRKAQSLSDEDIPLATEFAFPRDPSLYLPHYQSNDSALDVTGFDSISRKCLSYENIDVKTVDVFTDTCILPGTSDPDISKMTLQSKDGHEIQTSVSLPNTPPFLDYRTKCDHTYSFSSKESVQGKTSKTNDMSGVVNMSTDNLSEHDPLYRSPLFDHSYNTSGHKQTGVPKQTGATNSGIKRVRSIDKMDTITKSAFTKSPFLDHTYQSLEWQAAAYKHCTVLKRGRKQSSEKVHDKTAFPTASFLDHNYDVLDSSSQPDLSWTRSRSSSMSGSIPVKFDEFKSDHSYVIDNNTDDDLSDSGTESYNGDGDEEMSTIFGSLVTLQKDHSYVTKKLAL